MSIQISKGILGDLSPFISFRGRASDGTSATSTANKINSITIDYNSEDSDYVDVIDDNLSTNNNHTTYELYKVHYSDWLDVDGNSFGTAQNVIQYVQQLVIAAEDRITFSQTTAHRASGIPETVNASVGIAFTYNANYNNAVSYFWDEASFPAGVDVSRYDRRRISGIVTQTGTYTIDFQIANHNGTVPTSVIIDVT